LADGSIKLAFEDDFTVRCPNRECSNSLRIRRRSHEWGVVVRNCYECFARIKYNVDSQAVEDFTIETPLAVPAGSIANGRGPCPYCSYSVVFKGTKNSRGEIVQFCPKCTQLMLVEGASPSMVSEGLEGRSPAQQQHPADGASRRS
jgi:hypothetical protein